MKAHVFAAMILVAVTTTAVAAVSPEDRCQAAKTKAGGDYLDCRQSAEAKYLQNRDAAKRTQAIGKCNDKVFAAFTQAEARAGGACPTSGDAAEVEQLATQCSQTLTESVETGGSVPACGDGVVNMPGEHCDGADLGGATCASLSYDIGDLGCNGACKFEAGRCGFCDEDSIVCGGACVDTSVDEANCGACGTVCDDEQTCQSGVCACGGGETLCGGSCIDTEADPDNCGGCGVTCGETEQCVLGECRASSGDCTGFSFGDVCWYLSNGSHTQNCAQRCALEGRNYDTRTMTMAGHLAPNNSACQSVLTGLGHPGPVNDLSAFCGTAQYDCHVNPYGTELYNARCTSGPNTDNAGTNVLRACACLPPGTAN